MMKSIAYIFVVLVTLWECLWSLPLEILVANRTIIAFGDSLTEGMYISTDPNDKFGFHSYALQLQKRLNGTDAYVSQKGKSGARATELMYDFPTILKAKRRTDPIFVIILAGTNDLGARLSHSTIVWHLKKIHNAVQHHSLSIKKNIYTIAIGIPEISWPIKQSDRIKSNEEMKEYAEKCFKTVSYISLETQFNQTVPENRYLWSKDMVHFSRQGYDKMGDIIYDKMKEFAVSKTEDSLVSMDIDSICT